VTTSSPTAVQIDVLQQTDFRLLLVERLMSALAGVGFATVIGYQIYTMTRDPLSLGWLGLVEAIPALSLSLIGGYIADRANRKRIVLTTEAVNILCMLTLMWFAFNPERYGLGAIYGVVAVIGFAIGFFRPASSAFEQQVIPLKQAARGASLTGSMWLTGGILGGPLAGFSIDFLGIPTTYGLIALLMAVAFICFALIPERPVPPAKGRGDDLAKLAGRGALCVAQPTAGRLDGTRSLCRALWGRDGAVADLCDRYSWGWCVGLGLSAHRAVDWRAARHGRGDPPPADDPRRAQSALVCRRLWRQHDRLWDLTQFYSFTGCTLLCRHL
jgi:MFS family permease